MRQDSISLLQSLRSLLEVDRQLGPSGEELVKSTFIKILQSGDTYSVKEIEDWFGHGDIDASTTAIERIVNMAHYQKSKFEATNKFRIVSEEEDSSCGCNH